MNKFILILKSDKNFLLNYFFLIFLSFYLSFSGSEYINQDGINYLLQANLFLENKITDALEVNGWPFYGFMISVFSRIFFLSLENAAFFLNSCLLSVMAYYFLRLFLFWVKDSSLLFIPTILLLSSIPIYENYASMIIRDHGYWAFFLSSLYFYCHWLESKRRVNLLFLAISLSILFLFRLEGLIFILFYTFFILYSVLKGKKGMIICLLFFLFSLGLLLVINLDTSNLSIFSQMRFNDYFDKFIYFYINISKPLPIYSDHMWLQYLLNDYSISFKFLFFIYIFFLKSFLTFGFVNIMFIFFAIKKGQSFGEYKIMFIFLFILSLSLPLINFFTNYVISSRYLISTSLLLCLFSSFGFVVFLKNKMKFYFFSHKTIKIFIILIIIFKFLNVFFDSKQYHDKEVAMKISESGFDPQKIYIDKQRILYYLGTLSPVRNFSEIVGDENYFYFYCENNPCLNYISTKSDFIIHKELITDSGYLIKIFKKEN